MEEKQRGITILIMGGTAEHICVGEALPRCISLDTPVNVGSVKWGDDSCEDINPTGIDAKTILHSEHTLTCSIEPESIQDLILAFSGEIKIKTGDGRDFKPEELFLDISYPLEDINNFLLGKPCKRKYSQAEILELANKWSNYIDDPVLSTALNQALSFTVPESQRASLEKLAGIEMALKICPIDDTSYQHFILRDEYKSLHRSYSAFHNAIYGAKFRQSKKSTKLQAKANKVNARRNRNSLIKNRIHNYNKPATL